MREIKFRAWNPERKEMDYFDLDSYDKNYHCQYGNESQYTGLKDKNGVDIYDGDLLSHPYFDDPIAVEWNHDDACFESNGVVREWADCEVIGNIYQNPELLTQENAA